MQAAPLRTMRGFRILNTILNGCIFYLTNTKNSIGEFRRGRRSQSYCKSRPIVWNSVALIGLCGIGKCMYRIDRFLYIQHPVLKVFRHEANHSSRAFGHEIKKCNDTNISTYIHEHYILNNYRINTSHKPKFRPHQIPWRLT